MRNIVILIIIVLVLAAVAYSAFRPRTAVVDQDQNVAGDRVALTPDADTSATANPSQTATATGTDFSPVINASFNVSGSNYRFDVPQIKVKKGDKVKITFLNMEGTHDFVIDDFNVATPQIKSGETASVTFTADKTGTFEYYCSVGNHRQMGMVGKLIVEE